MSSSTAGRIAEAARGILVAEGTDAVSMRRVAAEVGITPMAIYRHYPNREALLEAIASTAFAELAERWAGTLQGPGSRLGRALDAYLDFALEQPRLYTFLFTEPRADARRYPEDMRAGASPTMTIVADALRDGVRAGVFREHDVWEVALMTTTLLHGLVQLYHAGRISLAEQDFRALCRAGLGRVLDGIRT
ncbi:TetR/AcrR family transcriptional regulator [Solihabitans fulvus]|uniref:TetR/AcrR family transcriptional regulator n=1 Tax=Solihabitans fulvus TaxID=1892852 RepID=A0A5B2WEY2_9PSEU|nr:TetR/AcrR family transcriptional regulator [Solihabitans fulvus]KAA2250743.1 TetR/AcrR family transcriptional regulator [Solihabitans fulvus]